MKFKFSPRSTAALLSTFLLSQVKPLKRFHVFSDMTLKKLGFKWELRRRGELKIGLWRRTWGKVPARERRRLVIIPGLGDTPVSWTLTLSPLSWVIRQNYDELIVFDLPGFAGFLAEEKAFHSMDRLFEATHDILYSLKPHTIIGHSLGGWLASQYLQTVDSRPPKQVILIAPSGVLASERGALREFKKVFTEAIQIGFQGFKKRLFKTEPIWFRVIEAEMGNFFNKEEIQSFIHSIEEKHLLKEKIPKNGTKTWLLWGETDTIVPPRKWAHEWLEKIEGSELVELKGVGHSPQLEAPGRLALVLGLILSKNASPALWSKIKSFVNWTPWGLDHRAAVQDEIDY